MAQHKLPMPNGLAPSISEIPNSGLQETDLLQPLENVDADTKQAGDNTEDSSERLHAFEGPSIEDYEARVKEQLEHLRSMVNERGQMIEEVNKKDEALDQQINDGIVQLEESIKAISQQLIEMPKLDVKQEDYDELFNRRVSLLVLVTFMQQNRDYLLDKQQKNSDGLREWSNSRPLPTIDRQDDLNLPQSQIKHASDESGDDE